VFFSSAFGSFLLWFLFFFCGFLVFDFGLACLFCQTGVSHLKNSYNVVGLGRKKKNKKKDGNTDKQSVSACFRDC